MKRSICVVFLFFSVVSMAQQGLSFGNNQIPKSKFQFHSLPSPIAPFSLGLTYANQKNKTSDCALEIYNPMTQMNDNFVKVNNMYYRSNTKSFSYYGIGGVKTDSLNPYGASDIGSALVTGLIDLLLSSKNGF